MRKQYGIFSEDSETRFEYDALEVGFYSEEEATAAMKERYADDETAFVAEVEEEGEDEELDDDEWDDDEDYDEDEEDFDDDYDPEEDEDFDDEEDE